MKLYFSPFFNGHSYIDYEEKVECNGGLLGEALEATEGLLGRLELMCGMPGNEAKEEKRIEEYYDALKASVCENDMFYSSFHNDSKDNERYNVTTELLRWRDTLIMAGWDRISALPGKLEVISQTEREVKDDGSVRRGSADRWQEMYKSGKVGCLKERVKIEVLCPKVLIEPLVRNVISQFEDATCYKCEDMGDGPLKDCTIINFKEVYEACQWLSQQAPQKKQVIVCNDGQRLDNVLRGMSKPVVSGDANIDCHHVVTDIRSMLDVPESVIWVDCNGGYNFFYPYAFLTEAEKIELKLPTEMEMIEAVNKHYVYQLNRIKDVTLVSATYD